MHKTTRIQLLIFVALTILQVVASDPSANCTSLTPAPAAKADKEETEGRVFRWIAISCGAIINIVIGGYAGMSNILETEGRWTQRLEFVKDESRWWFGMSSIVLMAFGMDVVAFAKGESVDATILLLAAEVGIVIFVYVVQGTLHSQFRQLLWLAWTGSSRTGCGAFDVATLKGLILDRQELGLTAAMTTATMKEKQKQLQPAVQFESNVDIPGYGTVLTRKIKHDLITVLKQRAAKTTVVGNDEEIVAEVFASVGSTPALKKFVYPPHHSTQQKVSVLWGGENCSLFSRRVSRGITGYTLDRIRSSYSLVNVDESKWMFVAGGIVARNKGLTPARLICGLITVTTTSTISTRIEEKTGASTVAATTAAPTAVTTTAMTLNTKIVDEVETASKWRPRQAKTSRSRYAQEANAQFSGLGQQYCAAVVEIALLMQDLPNRVVIKALQANIEQQSCEKMWRIHAIFDGNSNTRDSCIIIQDAMYVCQYMTLCAKLNWYGDNNERPDLIMGLMYATFKRLDWTFDGADEESLSEILREELKGLDLGAVGGKTDDILFRLGAYLGIEQSLRKQVIEDLSDKFMADGAVRRVLSGDLSSPAVMSENVVNVGV
ncbi:hypothetical protein BGW42_001995 [Actinomortierella wolfii]|nr:hypothetical protein BGW42_001995 [Actinomortierella wolfii]